jgi:hypothetical protein
MSQDAGTRSILEGETGRTARFHSKHRKGAGAQVREVGRRTAQRMLEKLPELPWAA